MNQLPDDLMLGVAVRARNIALVSILSPRLRSRFTIEMYSYSMKKSIKYLLENGLLDAFESLVACLRAPDFESQTDTEPGFDFYPWMMKSAIKSGLVRVIDYLQANDVPLPPDPIGLAFKYNTDRLVSYFISLGYLATEQTVARAASAGRLNIIKRLAEMGVHPTEDAVVRAAKHGHLAVIEYLASVGVVEHKWSTAIASRRGHLTVLKQLAATGPINPVVVHNALLGHHDDIIWYLVDHDPQLFDNNFYEVVEYGDLRLIRRLIRHRNDFYLQAAFHSGRLEVVQYLYNLGTPVPTRVLYSGSLALIKHHHETLGLPLDSCLITDAARTGQLDVIEYALNHGVAIGAGVIQEAIDRDHYEVFRYLIQHQAPVDMSLFGDVAQWSFEAVKDLVPVLIDQLGEERVLLSWEWEKALVNAARNGQYRTVRYLVEERNRIHDTGERAGDLEDESAIGTDYEYMWPPEALNAVCAAADNGHLRIVRYLESNNFHCSPHYIGTFAPRHGHLSIIKHFVYRSEVNQSDLLNFINGAASGGYLSIVKYLLTLIEPTNETLNCAVDGGNLSIVKLLREEYGLMFQPSDLADAIDGGRRSVAAGRWPSTY